MRVYILPLLLSVFIISCSEEAKTKKREKRIPVITTRSKIGTIENKLLVKGSTVASKKAIISPKISGCIENIFFDEGRYVSKKELLAQIESKRYALSVKHAKQEIVNKKAELKVQISVIKIRETALAKSIMLKKQAIATLNEIKARVERVKAQGEKTQADFQRMKHLFSSESISKQRFEHATAEYKTANAIVSEAIASLEKAKLGVENSILREQQAEAELEEAKAIKNQKIALVEKEKIAFEIAKEELDNTNIFAPIAGTIMKKSMEIGEMASPGKQIFLLSKIDPIEVKADISSRYLNIIKVGTPVILFIDGIAEPIMSQISEISPEVDPRLRMIEITISLSNKEKRIKPGLFTNIEIILQRSPEATIIRKECIIRREGKRLVYIISGGIAREVFIKTGLEEKEYIEVLSGIKAKDILVIQGQKALSDGDKVLVQNLGKDR